MSRPPLPYAPKEIRERLQRRFPELLGRLGVKDQPRNGIVTPLNPRRNDRRPGSFVIWTSGEGIGAWRDYATGEHGDVYDLITYLLRLTAWIDGYWWALEFLGLERGHVRSASQAQLDAQLAERERKAAEARAGADLAKKARAAAALWFACEPQIKGTPVWTYLTEARGLPLERLGRQPGAIRFHPALEHVAKDTGEVTEWPAMVSVMSHGSDGQPRAVHRTWLMPDGSGKAPVDKAKKMRGPARGCAIRLWKGGSLLSPEKAALVGERKTLIVTEGIEDGLTAAIAAPTSRVWAAGSLSLMQALEWPACAGAVVLVADNDWDTPEALAAFDKTLATWREMAKGRPLKAVRAAAGKDLNDWARGVG